MQEVETAFSDMLDISTDIDKAVVFTPTEVLATNAAREAEADMVGKARELLALGTQRAAEMGSQPLTQLVVETPLGFVFVAHELDSEGMAIVATGKKGSRVGLVLYDLKTCLRDVREALGHAAEKADGAEMADSAAGEA